MSGSSSIPFVVGQWVRGERFYGRAEQLAEILDGHRNSLWLLGTRRVGKTSLLKQLEHLTSSSSESGYFPVFWDFQGSEDPAELHLDFADALLDAEERLDEIGIPLAEIEADDLFVSLGRLRRRLRAKRCKLLLLCDEVEELIKLNEKEPALLRKLRRAMQSREGIRSVLASSIRLWALAEQRDDTSPFLHGFTPPIYIHTLSDDEARALIRQTHLPEDSRPAFEEAVVEVIRERCDNHPYLIQLVCKRCLELEDVEAACEEVATDRMVSYFFSVDYEMLSETERDVIRVVAAQSAATSRTIQQSLSSAGGAAVDSGSLSGSLHRLEHLGFIRRDAERRYVLANYFFRRWLEDMPAQRPSSTPVPEVKDADATLEQDLALGVLGGRYELQRQLGAGATGVVYKAWDKLLEVQIAIKVLKDDYAANEEALERFRQEIVLSRDIGHPNVLRVYHLGEDADAGKRYLTMQLVDGETLARMIAVEAPFAEPRILALAGKLTRALAAAHARRVLHRDVKPHNILVGEGDEPFITDFGLARVIGQPGITRGGLFLGTPYYTSPEQADLKPLDERSDLYALGLILYEMAVGRRPFEAETTQEVLEMHRHTPPPDPRAVEPGVSRRLAGVILRCLEKDPADRYPDAEALLRALRAN